MQVHFFLRNNTKGPVILFSRLYRLSNNHLLLEFAEKVFNFWFQNMVLPNGHVCDHISADGSKECGWEFTYNEGLMIGAATELYLSTNNSTFLEQANLITSFLINNEVER